MNLSRRLLPHNNFSRFKIPWSAVFTSFIQRKLTFSRILAAPVNVTFIRTYNLKKNVPWHILSPRAVACDNLHLRASAHHWHVSAFCVIGNSSEFPVTQKRAVCGWNWDDQFSRHMALLVFWGVDSLSRIAHSQTRASRSFVCFADGLLVSGAGKTNVARGAACFSSAHAISLFSSTFRS